MSIRVQYLTLQSESNARSLLPENGAQGIKKLHGPLEDTHLLEAVSLEGV